MPATRVKTVYQQRIRGRGQDENSAGNIKISSEGLEVGRDSGDAVCTENNPQFEFTSGTIKHVTVNVSCEHYVDLDLEAIGMMERD